MEVEGREEEQTVLYKKKPNTSMQSYTQLIKIAFLLCFIKTCLQTDSVGDRNTKKWKFYPNYTCCSSGIEKFDWLKQN